MGNPLGRPVTDVPVKHERALSQLGAARARAIEEEARASARLDPAILAAYMDGVPVMRIADIAGITRVTVYKSLRRQGVDI